MRNSSSSGESPSKLWNSRRGTPTATGLGSGPSYTPGDLGEHVGDGGGGRDGVVHRDAHDGRGAAVGLLGSGSAEAPDDDGPPELDDGRGISAVAVAVALVLALVLAFAVSLAVRPRFTQGHADGEPDQEQHQSEDFDLVLVPTAHRAPHASRGGRGAQSGGENPSRNAHPLPAGRSFEGVGRSPDSRIVRFAAPSQGSPQWLYAATVPGYSGGGRAGFTPASHTRDMRVPEPIDCHDSPKRVVRKVFGVRGSVNNDLHLDLAVHGTQRSRMDPRASG